MTRSTEMLARLIAVLLVFAPLGATAQRVATNVSGVYQSNWDEVTLTQRGTNVTGTYVCCGGGTIDGRIIEGRTIRYRWKQPNGSGFGVWTIEDDRLEGTWGGGSSDHDGGRWDLVRAP